MLPCNSCVFGLSLRGSLGGVAMGDLKGRATFDIYSITNDIALSVTNDLS